MSTGKILSDDDHCRRMAYYGQRWRSPVLRPKEILTQSVDFGLMASGDAGDAAESESYRLATEIGIDTSETDLLSLAEHIASLASFIAYLLRTGDPWKRPEPVSLHDGLLWTSGAFLSQNDRFLRRVAIVDRWDAWAQLALENSWQVAGECAAYQVPMNVIVVEIGQLRKGRWSCPLTTAFRHPVSKTLRFRKRDGEDFGATWEKVWREKDKSSRDEWLDAMTEDGVLAEVVHVHQVEVPPKAKEMLDLAVRKLLRVESQTDAPDPQFSQCFDRIYPCPFRSCCPRGEEPSESLGFVRITSCPEALCAGRSHRL